MKNSGAAENGVVHLVNDGFSYPNIKDVLRITIVSVEDNAGNGKPVRSNVSGGGR